MGPLPDVLVQDTTEAVKDHRPLAAINCNATANQIIKLSGVPQGDDESSRR